MFRFNLRLIQVYNSNNKAKLASSKAGSSLVTPTLTNPKGDVTVTFIESKYSTNNTTITISIIDCAYLITKMAMARKENRGLHYSIDLVKNNEQ